MYVVLSGSGRAKLDDEIIDLGPMDALRVSPTVTRAFEAGPDGLELLAFGLSHKGDGETIQGWWATSRPTTPKAQLTRSCDVRAARS